MLRPFGRCAQHGGDETGLGGGRLKWLGLPGEEGRCNGLAVVGAVQQLEDALAMMRKIRMQPDLAAITGGVDAGDFVPGRTGWLSRDPEIALAAELDRGVAHVDADGLPLPRALAPDGRGSQRRGGDAGLGDRANPKG